MTGKPIPSAGHLPSALARWHEFQRDLAGRTPALFLDYDGTLTPIVEHPDSATLSDDMRRVVRRLAERFDTTIVSGRAREDVARRVAVDDVNVAGSHGFDIAGRSRAGSRIRHEVGKDIAPLIGEVAARLDASLAGTYGVIVEPKTFMVAVHYRLVADEHLAAVEAAVDRVLADYPQLRKAEGKKVFELRPRLDWDKGKAVLWLLGALDLEKPDIVPVYVGDDTTDEDAFHALQGVGIPILVTASPRPTAAAYTLRDTDEVREFLERITQLPA